MPLDFPLHCPKCSERMEWLGDVRPLVPGESTVDVFWCPLHGHWSVVADGKIEPPDSDDVPTG